MPKRRKYEVKQLEWASSVRLPRRSLARVINRSRAKLLLLFILAAGNFSNMFTTYSHKLVVVLASGLRLEISCESDKKKMNFIFNYDKKILLTAKMKRVSRREKKKQCVEEIPGVSRNGF